MYLNLSKTCYNFYFILIFFFLTNFDQPTIHFSTEHSPFQTTTLPCLWWFLVVVFYKSFSYLIWDLYEQVVYPYVQEVAEQSVHCCTSLALPTGAGICSPNNKRNILILKVNIFTSLEKWILIL